MADSKTTPADLRKMSTNERAKLLTKDAEALALIIPLLKSGKEKQSHKKLILRKEIARLKTINSELKHA